MGRGIAALLAGEFRWAGEVLRSVEQDRSADSMHRLLAQLSCTVIDLVTAGCDDPSGRLGQIALDAELAGLPWVARLSRGLGEAVLVAQGSPPWRLKACIDLLGECERAGDHWGAALLRLSTAIGGQIADPSADPDEFADAARRFRRLEAPVLALWAESMQACVLARAGAPGAAEFAGRIAAQARAIQLGGAQALAMMALTIASGNRSGDADGAAGGGFDAVAVDDALHAATLLLSGFTGATPEAAPGIAVLPNGSGSAAVSDGPAARVAPGADAASTAEPAGSMQAPDRLPDSGEPRAVRVRCFGGFALEVDGHAVDLGPLRPRARALLRLLALTPDRDVHRELLVDALWPGVDLAVGTRRLQVAVSSVRQLLEHAGLSGSEVLARHGDAYQLAPPAGSVIDVVAFEQGMRDAALSASRGDTMASMAAREAALSLYTGDVLPEDGPAEYVVVDRERLRLAAAAAAGAMAQDGRALGHHRQALAAARLSVQLDRFQDLAWQLLVELHEESGDGSAAALARREHAQAQAELDSVT